MSLESRFDPPTPREEPKPLVYCDVCGVDIYRGDYAYELDSETYCDDCGLDYLQTLHRRRMD